ncbi:MAG: FKBP-type peptidyl-prolyl cis-trans isomerase [Leptolyngbyaceae cyanobacterium SM1_3_5]|nr:FKBP-type peptidyl-prolyl cis-trans isomerase [Leptolyngbyaceae cyanobacterium SM1_3_5]
MREILISVGVMLVCIVFLVVAQFNQPQAAIATPLQPPIEQAQLSTPMPDNAPDDATEPASTSETTPETASPESATPEAATTTDSGLQYVDLVEGTGAVPRAGQTVYVHYTGTLEDGTKFDSSRDRNRPFSFRLGAGQVIRGWDEGISTMRVGGRRQLVIPPDLGYGSRGVGPIPPNSTLVFDVELLRIG